MSGFAIFVGEAIDQNGGHVVSKLTSPEGYTCTALTTVEIMKRILNDDPSTLPSVAGQRFKTGFQTPSLAYGPDFIMQFDGVKREDIS